jgi:hypothetical protein
VVACQDVVNVIDPTRSHSDFGEVSRPNSSIGIFCLVLGIVGRINS